MDQSKPRRSIRLQIVALSLLFTLITVLIITVGSIVFLSRELERSTLQGAEYALQIAASAVHKNVDEVDSLVDWCAVNATLRTYFLSDMAAANLVSTIYPVVSGKYNSMRTLPYIQRFLLINDQNQRLMFGTNTSMSMDTTVAGLRTLPGLGEGEEDITWSGLYADPLMLPTQATVGILQTSTITKPGTTRTAQVYLSVSTALVTDPLREFALAEGGALYWYMGGRLYAVQNGALVEIEIPADGFESYHGDTLDPATSLYATGRGQDKTIYVVYPLGVHDMLLIEVIPTAPIRSQLPAMLGTLPIILLGVLSLGIVLTLLLRRTISGPVTALQNRIRAISGGDFTADPAIEWNNELGDIGRGINELSRSVMLLLDKRVEDAKQKKDLEYRMLQNQINPHFIYNTLNSIKWMATIQHAPGIAEMVTALSRLMKSVSKGNEKLVPLMEEFALLNDYFTIQQYRYGGTITLDVTYIEDECLTRDCLIPRFTLQPLVENAIFHGIEPKGCAGNIGLTVTRDSASGDVLLRLTDDGVGMTPEQAAKALQPPSPEEEAAKFRHVGMWNVHRRLQYSFGDAYGLSIESVPGEGTTVIVRLPKESEKGESQ